MSWRELFGESFTSLKFYRRRTLVTVLSLAWGVASFILLMSYGNGFGELMESSFNAVGQDLVVVVNGQTSLQAGGLRAGRRIRLEREDVEAIRESVPLIGRISPEKFTRRLTVVRGNREKQIPVRGANAEYKLIRNMSLATGRWFTDEDLLQRNRVAVLGASVARQLFSGIPPESEEISIAANRFTVIGVLEPKGQLAQYSSNDNDCIFIPYDSMSLFSDIHYPEVIVWTPVSGVARREAIRQMRITLAGIHRFSPNDTRAVEVIAFNDFLYIVEGMSMAASVLVGFIGSLTLAIGGVGLANIMLASVVERTREIGVLKALGGRKRAIRGQFLIEALMIVGAGGVLGTVLGVALTRAIGSMPLLGPLFQDAAEKGDLHFQVSPGSILVSIGVLLTVGLVAGMVPAFKASRLDPIEALRYE
jgi:putative ABC transport system permease protein